MASPGIRPAHSDWKTELAVPIQVHVSCPCISCLSTPGWCRLTDTNLELIMSDGIHLCDICCCCTPGDDFFSFVELKLSANASVTCNVWPFLREGNVLG